jgi:hypothetical protein
MGIPAVLIPSRRGLRLQPSRDGSDNDRTDSEAVLGVHADHRKAQR